MEAGAAERDALANFNHHTSDAASLFALYEQMHAGCPVGHSDELGGFYILSRHADVRAAAANWKDFSSAQGFVLPRLPFQVVAVEMDPPDHTRWRALLNEILKLESIRGYTPQLRATADSLIDRIAPRGRADAVGELAGPFPMLAILGLIGITEPARIAKGSGLATDAFAVISDPEEFGARLGTFIGFCLEERDARRAEPREDYLTRLAADESLTDSEFGGLMMGFMLAGVHSTTSAMASLLRHVAADPELRDRLDADRDFINAATEEALRVDTPLHTFFRTTTRDVEVAGTAIPEGSKVMLCYGAANRDESVFECPAEFSVDRGANRHMAFGHGIHTCVGAQFARLQLRTMLEVVLDRLPNFRLAGSIPPYQLVGGQLMTPTLVPVTWDA